MGNEDVDYCKDPIARRENADIARNILGIIMSEYSATTDSQRLPNDINDLENLRESMDKLGRRDCGLATSIKMFYISLRGKSQ